MKRVRMGKKIISIFVMTLIIIAGLSGLLKIIPINVQATNVSGNISTNTTWDLAGSPYIVVGDMSISSVATLTIDPGVEVRFNGHYSIYCDGKFIAIGTESQRINITSNKTTPAPDDWHAIYINPPGHAEIKYTNISYARYGLYLFKSSNNISESVFSYSRYDGIFLDRSSFNNITGNIISSNIRYGIYASTSSYNNVLNNSVLL